MPAGDIYQAVFVTRAAAQNILQVRHYRVGVVVPLEPSPQQMVDEISSLIGPLIRNAISVEATYQGVLLRQIFPIPGGDFSSVLQQGTGNIAGHMLPLQVALLISLRTGAPGRAGRGRIYVGPAGEASNTALARPEPAYLTGEADLLRLSFVAVVVVPNGAGSAELIPSIYHRSTNIADNILASTVRPDWATQRRRSQINRSDLSPVL